MTPTEVPSVIERGERLRRGGSVPSRQSPNPRQRVISDKPDERLPVWPLAVVLVAGLLAMALPGLLGVLPSGPVPGGGSPSVTDQAVPENGTGTTYLVNFTESGLPSGTSWSVILNGQSQPSSLKAIFFSEPNGSYAYTVGGVSGYSASPSSGNVVVNGSVVRVAISFSLASGGPLTITFFTANPATVSLGGSTHISTVVSGGTIPYTYTYRGLPSGCSSTAAAFSCTPTTTGSYLLAVVVTDANGTRANASTQLAVTGANGTSQLAIQVATSPSPASGPAPLAVSFKATVSGGNPPYGVNWNFGDSTPWGQGMNVTHTYNGVGAYTACGYAYDSRNASASQCVNVTVTGGNGSSPLAIQVVTLPSPASGPAPLTVSFMATVSGGSPPYGVNWNFGDNTPWGQGMNVTHTYNGAGTYTACGYAYDSRNASASQCVSITVTGGNANLSVSAQARPLSGSAPLSVNFWANATGGVAPYVFSWAFGDGGSGTGSPITHTYTAAGTYAVTVIVTDSQGATVAGHITVTVGNGSTSPSLSMTASPLNGSSPLTVTFDLSVTQGTSPYTLYLYYGDQNNSNSSKVVTNWSGASTTLTHTYSSQGIYTAWAHVVDDMRLTASASVTITIHASNTGNGNTTGQPSSGSGNPSRLSPWVVGSVVGAVAGGVASVWGGRGLVRWHRARKMRRALA